MVSGFVTDPSAFSLSPGPSGGWFLGDPAAVRRARWSFFLNLVKAPRDSNVIGITRVQCRAAYNRRDDYWRHGPTRRTPMLAEKFFLLLETIRSHAYQDGSPRVFSTSQHVPIKLPAGK
jgi:hypothetical protein